MKVYVLGAGGGGSWAVPALCMLIGKDNVIVMDGDKLERKNLNRQLFTENDLGRNKAEALADKYGCGYIDEWFSFGARSYDSDDVLISCVDNHPGRIAVLETCDYNKCKSILCGNEVHSSSAQMYLPEWNGTNLDPRVMFPELLTDTSGDPRRGAIGCTGEPQIATPQLVSANLMAVAQALHLFVVWIQEARKLPYEIRQHLPHLISQSLSRSESFKAQFTT